MHDQFYTYIKPYVSAALVQANLARKAGDIAAQFKHLETAHVLGQSTTRLHTKIHFLMLLWAIRQGDIKEALGQIMRIIGAATKTAFGLVPKGNTGGTNVSPFQTMPIKAELAKILDNLNSG